MKGVYVGNGKSIVIGDYCKINDYVRLNNVIIGKFFGKYYFKSVND
jgi:hypothetical protein